MIKKITLSVLVFFSVVTVFSQGQNYNSFTTRNFMKFNRFLTVPTFSALRENKTSISAIVRNSFVDFEDAPRLYLGTYSGKMRENVGAGIAIYQQEVGVFKDFGALVNYAHKIKMSESMDLTFGFNFLYSRRSADAVKVNASDPNDPLIANFQDIPIVNFQPAVTLSFGKFDVGVFFENLLDFNLKKNELATSFNEKTYSAHAMYTHEFTYASGIFEGADLRVLALARKPGQGDFGFGGTVIYDLPKAGWVKVGYDKQYGISAGLGVNLSENLALGFTYEKGDFAATNEVGLIYNFGEKSYRRRRPTRRTPSVNVSLPDRKPQAVEPKEYDNPEHNDLSDEIQRAQDSINTLHKKLDEVLRLLKNQPPKTSTPNNNTTVVPTPNVDDKDTSLRRRSNKPWRQKTITRSGASGGGTMYYVVADRFKSIDNVQAFMNRMKRNKNNDIDYKYVFDPSRKNYYVYIDRFVKKEDAEEKVDEFKEKNRLFESDTKDDSTINVKGGTKKQNLYALKITLGRGEGTSDSYQEPKVRKPARIAVMRKAEGLEEGYYLQTVVNSKKPLADRNVDELRNDDINADYFVNPKTGYMHIYIFKTKDRNEALKMYNSNLNGAYYDPITIVHIK
ncbi:hypothetical protein WH52_10480 [Tenacibaculum holothuriorum]|uniref:SPOR domain-containing protein n=1 Tax=Tenacibaculum holothuriorum TaxID=1635173 RepID=A0A1Y2PCC7_9FLAO|nr:PorP/SprF family type IX secretion system membrane protein [Tenacibaculum holothuriorum]OSY87840.1 hypothetical protein WH52_10480 [Tenacibaculum holothuriorum]